MTALTEPGRLRERVPRSLTGDVEVMLSSVVLHGEWLPTGFLTHQLLPVLTLEPAASQALLPLPDELWDRGLIDRFWDLS